MYPCNHLPDVCQHSGVEFIIQGIVTGTVGFALLAVGITDEIVRTFLDIGDAQCISAVLAFQQSCEDIHESGFTFPFPAVQTVLGIVPQLLGNQSRKHILHYDPLIFVLLYNALAFEGSLSPFAADEVSQIGLVLEHLPHRCEVPFIRIFRIFPARLLCLIGCWRDYLPFGQHTGNFVVAISFVCRHLENFQNHRCSSFVDFQNVLVRLGFSVPVRCL